MKKTKLLALTLVVAIMMMGAGYAAWQETLTINHNVSTGNVDVDLANGNVAVYPKENATAVDGLNRIATVVGSEQEATITLTNLYPGAKVVANIPVINNSTIPVKYLSTTPSGVPLWLTVTDVCPSQLDVNGTGNIVVTMVVGDGVEEDSTATFILTPVYEQWNN
ncbi:hypothetical protein [Tissierella sp.]|uniref:hypothetical protein n=1 Tax=Tissierella sp. TaxID=41274 RepID=UPI0028673087|nr:hypothetical protein [Tissierella sp.]MDR7855063.1 hypothetical protein [Tissierella sp.]